MFVLKSLRRSEMFKVSDLILPNVWNSFKVDGCNVSL